MSSYALLSADGSGLDLVSRRGLLEDLRRLGVPVDEIAEFALDVEHLVDLLAELSLEAFGVAAILRRDRDAYRVVYAAAGAVEFLRTIADEAASVVPGCRFRAREVSDAR